MSDARRIALLLLIASAALIAGALFFQFVVKLEPCHLCLMQRWPHYVAIAILLVVVMAGDRSTTPWVIGLCGLIFLGSAGLGFYHAGVEQHWFPGPDTCTGPATSAGSVEEMKARILGTAVVRCDEVPWALFGISLAGWNFLASLALAGFALFSFSRLRRQAA
jgi:disulfide bond formation protein DsbB